MVAAITFFLTFKLAWVLVPILVMGMPRLGDDSYAYLWKSASTVATPQDESPAVGDIASFPQAKGAGLTALEWGRARTAMRTTGLSTSPLYIGIGLLLAAGTGHKLAFAAMEVATILVLSAGVFLLLWRYFGSVPAAAASALLAMAILPNQGIHYLVPGVMALGLALVLWTLVARYRQAWASPLAISVCMLLIHPIGQVYVLVAGAVIVLYVLMNDRPLAVAMRQLAALAVAFFLWQAIDHLAGFRPYVAAGTGGLDGNQALVNLRGLGHYLKELAVLQPALSGLCALGLVASAHGRDRDSDTFILLSVLVLATLSAVLVDLPGYPGELASRILVALVIVCAGAGARWMAEAMMRMRQAKAAWSACLLGLCLASQAPTAYAYFFGNINGRHQVIRESALRQDIAAVPRDAVVLWIDPDISLMASLLEGAARLRSLPMSMVDSEQDLGAALARIGAAEAWVAATYPANLNGLSMLESRSLQRRFYGFGFDAFRRITLHGSEPLPTVLWVRFDGPAENLIAVTEGSSANTDCVKTRDGEWVRISSCHGSTLHLESAVASFRITGVGHGDSRPGIGWPWGWQSHFLRAEPRSGKRMVDVRFDYASLFGPSNASLIASRFPGVEPVLDRGGVVWLRARASSPAS